MPSSINLKAVGLNLSPNQLDLPDGSLTKASNVIIRRDNVIEKRRGFKLYGEPTFSSTQRVKQLFTYRNQLIRHYDTTLEYDNGSGDFTAFLGTYLEPETGLRIRSVVANNNAYFTSATGIRKISSTGSNFTGIQPTKAGGVKAIDFNGKVLYENGLESGFMQNNSAVAYRHVWGIKDVNNNLVLGTPSERVELYNNLEETLVQDMLLTLSGLDKVGANAGSGLISDTDYVNTLKLPLNASGTEIRTNLLALADKIDNDILYANQTGSAPLQISGTSFNVTAGTATITFSSGTATNFFKIGDRVRLAGFLEADLVRTFTAVDITTERITFNNHGLVVDDVVFFTTTPPTGITANSLYYVINPTVNTFQVAITPGGAAVNLTGGTTGSFTTIRRGTFINGIQTITAVTGNTIQFATNYYGTVTTTSSATINSNNYRSITQPAVASSPATGFDLFNLQTYLENIISLLQIEPTSVISNDNLINFIIPLAITKTSNTQLTIYIPQDIISAGANRYFVQVYRSSQAIANDTTVLDDLIPSDELRLCYEVFPTPSELAAGVLLFTDIQPDGFLGANLYTNEASGEGLLQANEIPPFALDINRFKNVVFYSNTRTKQRKSLTMLGVSDLISAYNAGENPSITVSNGTITDTYNFILGVNELSQMQFRSTGLVSTNILVSTANPASFFLLDTPDNAYYVWYKNGTLPTDPAISNRIGIRVDILTTDTDNIVASKTRDALSILPQEFNAYFKFNQVNQGTTSINTTTDTINITNQSFILNNAVTVTSTGFLPGGLTAGTTYYIINPTTNSFQLSLTPSGAAIDITSTGSGTLTVNCIRCLYIENVKAGKATNIAAGTMPIGYVPSTDRNGDGQDVALKNVLLSNAVSSAQALDETARSLVRVINGNPTSPIYAYYLSTSNQVPGQMFFESKDLNADPFYILASRVDVGQSFNPEISPVSTITNISLANPTTITTASPHGLQNDDIVVISGSNSTPSVNGAYSVTVTGLNTFRIPVNVTVTGTLAYWSKAVDTEVSEDERKINRVYYSKLNQPEAVPLINYFDVGASDKAILRIFPLRDSLFVFKEDGLYRISGETAPFSLALFDSSCILIAPDSVDVSNNLVYCWTKQGISSVSEAGVNTVSRPIDTEVLRIGSSNFPNFRAATFGVGYESDNSYLVWTVQSQADTEASICYRYSNLTNTWTTYDKTNTCGIIKDDQDVLYLGAGDINYVEVERKGFNRLDYADREFIKNLNIDKYFGKTIILDNILNIEPGDSIVQDQTVDIYSYNMLLKKLDLDPGIPANDFYATLQATPGVNLRTRIELLTQKLDLQGLTYTDYFSRIQFRSGTLSNVTRGAVTTITFNNHGLLTSRYITIVNNTSTPSLNGTWPVTVLNANQFTIPISITTEALNGSWITPIDDFRDVLACYNLTINRLNQDQICAFSNYSIIDNNSLQEAIIISVNKITKQVVLNLALPYIVGPMTVYKSIVSEYTYAPATMGDALGWKHISEATMMFESKAFTSGTLSFSTDLLPQFIDVNFDAQSNGIFGHQAFGTGFFGGSSHSAPFRTYVPRNAQRCRYLNVKFRHNVARENVLVFGLTLTGAVGISTRAYRG